MVNQDWSIVFSKKSLWDERNNTPYPNLPEIVCQLHTQGVACYLFASQGKPVWLGYYPNIQYVGLLGRQSKDAARNKISELGRIPEKTLIVSCINADLFMSINSKILSIVAGWSSSLDSKAQQYGLRFNNPEILPKIMDILNVSNPWYYKYEGDNFEIYSLTNAGNKNNIQEMEPVIRMLRNHLKSGDNRFEKVFQLLFLSSLISTPVVQNVDYWAYFPASTPKKPEEEIIAQYADLARHAFGNRKKHPYPILIRHTATQARHSGFVGNRTDPNSQISTLKVHEYYKTKIRGTTVAIVDDFTTYGTSFGVAETLLKQAGARKVLCFSIGKFGDTLLKYNIELGSANSFTTMSENYYYKTERIASGERFDFALEELCLKMRGLI